MTYLADVFLPDRITRGSTRGPGWRTDVVSLSSGYEKRNIRWAQSRRRFNITQNLRTPDGVIATSDLEAILSTFEVCAGKAHSFPFRDFPRDYKMVRQSIGSGNGAATSFQIYRRRTRGSYASDTYITKPKQGTVKVWVNNVLRTETTHYTVNYLTGVISFVQSGSPTIPNSGHNVEVECEYYIPVRFDTDVAEFVDRAHAMWDWEDIFLIEVRGE